MTKDQEKEEYLTCHKSGKKVSKDDPKCPSPNIYCKYRHMCVIYELYKERNKVKKS